MSNDASIPNNPLYQSHLQRLPLPPTSTPSYSGTTEQFQYVSCPHCHSNRARLTVQTREQGKLFSIFCPFCGYEDADVSDH